MASGHPDWQTWAGRSVGGESVDSYSFAGSLPSGVTGTFDLPVVATGYKNTYQNITVSCNDDSAIHDVKLLRISDSWIFFEVNFIMGGIFDFPGQAIAESKQVRVSITNNSASTLIFVGSVFYTSTKV